MKDAPGWGFTSGERRAILLICAAVLIGIGYRLFQRLAIPESAPLTALDSAAVAAISLAFEPPSAGHLGQDGADSSAEVFPARSSEPLTDPGPIGLNSATRDQLEALPGIGPVLARRILETRDRLGGFRYFEQLLEVPGIGKVRLEQIRPLIIHRSSDSLSIR